MEMPSWLQQVLLLLVFIVAKTTYSLNILRMYEKEMKILISDEYRNYAK